LPLHFWIQNWRPGTGAFLPNARVSTVWAHICAMLRFFRELRSMWRQYQEFGLEVCALPLPSLSPHRCVARDAACGLAQEYTALRRQQQFLEEQTKLVCLRSQ